MAVTFAELGQELVADAKAAWAKLKAEATEIEHDIVPVAEADIVAVLSQFKQLAIDTVLKFAAAEFGSLTGNEKQGNVVTAVIQAAEAEGKTIALQDAAMLAQQAYDAVKTAAAGVQ